MNRGKQLNKCVRSQLGGVKNETAVGCGKQTDNGSRYERAGVALNLPHHEDDQARAGKQTRQSQPDFTATENRPRFESEKVEQRLIADAATRRQICTVMLAKPHRKIAL